MGKLLEPQKKWAEELAAQSGVIEKAMANMDKRNQAKKEVAGTLDNNLDAIKSGQFYEMAQKNTGALGKLYDLVGHQKKIKSLDPGGDPNKEMDTGHYRMGDFDELPPDQVKKIMEAQEILIEMTNKLRNAKGDDGENLFSDDDIAEEIWQTLVRQGAIPENAVPDGFSQVVKTFNSASAAYQDRLAKYSDELDDNHALLSKLGLSKDIIDGLGETAKGLTKVIGEFVPGMPTDEIETILELIQITGTSSLNIADKIISKKDAGDIFKSIGDIAAKAIAAGFIGQDGKEADDLKDIITESVTGAFTLGTAAAKFAEGDIEGAFSSVLDTLVNGLTAADTGKDADGKYTLIGESIKTSLNGSMKLAKAAKLWKEGKYDEARASLTEGLVGGITFGAQQGLEKYMKDNAPPEDPNATEDEKYKAQKEEDEAIESAKDELEEALEILNEAPEAVQLVMTTDPKKLDEMMKGMEGEEKTELEEARKKLAKLKAKKNPAAEKKFEKLQKARAQANSNVAFAKSEEESRAFTNMLATGDGGAPGEAENIEAMILAIKKQQKTLELAIKLSTMPFKAVGAFFPPAKMGDSLIKMAAEMAKAANCTKEYLKWREGTGDAKAAASVQAEAMANRAGLSSTQALRHGVEATLMVIKAIGEGLQLGAHFTAHIGVALAASASAASSAKKVIIEIEDKRRMAKAWKIYRTALENPSDRIMARKAMRKNPTLAKYAIAYGALYGHDRIAINMMAKCNLSEKVLSDKKSNVDKVVRYLETMYEEDPILLRAIGTPQDWHPRGEMALSPESWLAYVKGAQAKAKPKLSKSLQVSSVTNALAVMTDAKVTYDKGKFGERTLKDVQSLLDRTTLVLKALGSIKPVGEDNKKHEQFAEYIDALKAKAEIEIKNLTKELDTIPTEIEEGAIQALFEETGEDEETETVEGSEGEDEEEDTVTFHDDEEEEEKVAA